MVIAPPPRPTAFARFVAPARARPALWRLGLGLAIIAAAQAGCLFALVRGIALLQGASAADLWLGKLAIASTPQSALTLLALFTPLLVATAVVVRAVHKRPVRSLLGAGALRDAVRGAGVTFIVFTPLVGGAFALGLTQPNLPVAVWAAVLPLALAGVAVQTLAEEAIFRGYLTQQLAARFRTRLIWVGIPAVLFGLLHLDPGRLGAAAPAIVGAATLFGLIATDLTVRSGNLGTAWGVHFANNTVGLVVLGSPGSLTGLALRVSDQGTGDLAARPALILVSVLPLAIAWLILRRRRRT